MWAGPPSSLRRRAEQGNATAQYYLGVMHSEGRGVLKNADEAARCRLAAEQQGHPGAQNNLGLMYANGEGVPEDYREAVRR